MESNASCGGLCPPAMAWRAFCAWVLTWAATCGLRLMGFGSRCCNMHCCPGIIARVAVWDAGWHWGPSMELVFVICPSVVCTASPITPWAAVVFPRLCLPSGTDPGTLPTWCFVTLVVWSVVVVHHTDLLPICSLVFAVAALHARHLHNSQCDGFTRASFFSQRA